MMLSNIIRRKTIAGRLIAFSAVFVLTAMVIASAILWLIVAGVVGQQVDQRLDMQIGGLRRALSIRPDGTVGLGASLDGPPFDRTGSGWYWQVSGEGVRLTSRSLAGGTIDAPGRPLDWRRLLSGAPQPGEISDAQGQPLHVRTVKTGVGDRMLQITVTAPRSAVRDPATRSLLWLLPAMLILGAALLIGSLFQVRYGLRPLRQLTADIAAVRAGTRSRLQQAEVEELQPVSLEIDRLIGQNAQRLIDTRVHFANLAHGLKTPVTSLMLALDDRNDPDGAIRKLAERMDRRIRHHLADARRVTAGDVDRSPVLIRPRLDDLIAALSRIHADKNVAVTLDVGPGLSVACGSEDLDEVLGNLLDNAFKWCASSIEVSGTAQGGVVTIEIVDDGPGMTQEEIIEAFQPGRRLDETVPGSGFGLNIAREIVELYGGGVSACNQGSGGLLVSVSLAGTDAASPA
ncbi:signal transduction histidine kinase [Ensifer sp. KUDG1]|uniref:sensor histidine kinase n=1 Tax=Ensifer sp. KUDG1 TaxID=3373919 RepID=UPI003D1D0A5B